MEVPTRTAPVAPPTIVPCTKSASITRRPKLPAAANGRTISRSKSSSKYHLFTRKRCRPLKRSWMLRESPGRRTYRW